MRGQLSIGAFPCRASLPRVDLLVYRRAGILIYSKESASRRRSRRCMQKRRPRCMRRQRGTNKARYRRQMSKAKLGFVSARVCGASLGISHKFQCVRISSSVYYHRKYRPVDVFTRSISVFKHRIYIYCLRRCKIRWNRDLFVFSINTSNRD